MPSSRTVSVDGGKYKVMIHADGSMTALRHDEVWMGNLTGDNLVYWLCCEILDLKASTADLLGRFMQGGPLPGDSPMSCSWSLTISDKEMKEMRDA